MAHIPVLLHHCLEGLPLRQGEYFVDVTVGGGGHFLAFIKQYRDEIHSIGIDADGKAIKKLREVIKDGGYKNAELYKENFRNIEKVLASCCGDIKINAVLFDLGWSSDQLKESGRGFSFRNNEPLLMTFSDTMDEETLTAQDIVNTWEEENLTDIIRGYGEEKFAKRIARHIVKNRTEKTIQTSKELADIVKEAVPFWYKRKKIHPATKTFQALRITVNDELKALREGLEGAFKRLAPKGRMAVISFHSLEDRIVKIFFKEKKNQYGGIIITKKPIVPSEMEIQNNPRARSAKLRIYER